MSLEMFNEAETLYRKIIRLNTYMQDLNYKPDSKKYPHVTISNNYLCNRTSDGALIVLATDIPGFAAGGGFDIHHAYICTIDCNEFHYGESTKNRCQLSDFDEALDFQLSTLMDDLTLRNYYLFNHLKDGNFSILFRRLTTVQDLDNFLDAFRMEYYVRDFY